MQQQAICYRGKYSRKRRKKEAGRERRILLEKEIRWEKSSAQITEFSFVLHRHVGPHCVVGRLFFRKTINERKCPRVLGNITDDFIRNLRFVLVVILKHGICLKHRGHNTYHLLHIRHSVPPRQVV
jgi:hypothetical protein